MLNQNLMVETDNFTQIPHNNIQNGFSHQAITKSVGLLRLRLCGPWAENESAAGAANIGVEYCMDRVPSSFRRLRRGLGSPAYEMRILTHSPALLINIQ